jgi:hypothetical protein
VEFLVSIACKRRCWNSASARVESRPRLAARGSRVHGIDASEKMVAKMRAKPGGEAIQVEFGTAQR